MSKDPVYIKDDYERGAHNARTQDKAKACTAAGKLYWWNAVFNDGWSGWVCSDKDTPTFRSTGTVHVLTEEEYDEHTRCSDCGPAIGRLAANCEPEVPASPVPPFRGHTALCAECYNYEGSVAGCSCVRGESRKFIGCYVSRQTTTHVSRPTTTYVPWTREDFTNRLAPIGELAELLYDDVWAIGPLGVDQAGEDDEEWLTIGADHMDPGLALKYGKMVKTGEPVGRKL